MFRYSLIVLILIGWSAVAKEVSERPTCKKNEYWSFHSELCLSTEDVSLVPKSKKCPKGTKTVGETKTEKDEEVWACFRSDVHVSDDEEDAD